MDSAEAELQRRRERARHSQRAFRTRQAAMLRDLRDENVRLKGAIKAVVQISQSGNPLAIHSAIQKAATAAGFVPALSHDSTGSRHSDTISAPMATSLSTESPWAAMLPGVEQQRIRRGTEQTDSIIPHSLGPPRSDCLTFRLDFGILNWPTSLGCIVEPPVDIAPYLGPNRHTLAAQIYWYCTETSLRFIYQLAGHQPSRIASVAQHHPVFIAMLRHISTLCSPNYLVALAEARLEFYRVGHCKADNLAGMRDSALLLRQRVEQDCNESGLDLEQWLTATKVARIVGETLRSPELSRLEAAVRNDGADAVARRLLESFIHKLWLSSTCFGDGSRWKSSYVRQLLDWLAQALSFDR